MNPRSDPGRPVSTLWLLCIALWLASPTLASQETEALPEIQIVVADSNPTSELTCKEIWRFFMRDTSSWRWGDETLRAQPVDQVWGSRVHEAFARIVFGKTSSAIQTYWTRMMICPRPEAPPQVEDDAAVLRYVAREAGAIGYVTAGIDLGEGVKALKISSCR